MNFLMSGTAIRPRGEGGMPKATSPAGFERHRRHVAFQQPKLPFDALKALLQLPSCLRQQHAAAAANEQRGLKLFFDCLDLSAESRLRHPQSLRGAA